AVLSAVAVARRLSAPILDLTGAVEGLRTGDFRRRVKKAGPREVRQLVTAFNATVEDLQELSLGVDFQKELVPTAVRRVQNYDIASVLIARKQLSGDLINVTELRDGLIQIASADVSGKGLRSGMYSLLVLSLL